jgi:L-iditol 2-dehydrogenase
MRALQLVEYQQFDLVDLPTPSLQPDEVLIEVKACGICGSDIHGMDGSSGRRIPPIVMGHEAAGVITEVGASVTDYVAGDAVTFDSTIFCGECSYCQRGEINLCENRRVMGVSCGDYRQNGAFAEYVAAPSRILHRLPAGMSFEHAAMVEPVSIAYHAVRRSGIKPGQSAAVFGVGMIGLLIVQVLRVFGASRIVAIDLDPAKVALAKSLGATHDTLDEQVDVALEAVGITPTVTASINAVNKGGTVVLVGNLSPKVEIPLQSLVTRELNVFGTCGSQGEYPECLELIASGQVQVDPLITHRVGLEDAAEYFARLYKAEPGLMKVMVCP